jgi:hypothetical protein
LLLLRLSFPTNNTLLATHRTHNTPHNTTHHTTQHTLSTNSNNLFKTVRYNTIIKYLSVFILGKNVLIWFTFQHVPYPKSVFFIISNEFCERFSFYVMRTNLSLYLRQILLFTESDSTDNYHVYTKFAYLFPLHGAIVYDSWLGKLRTII